MSFRHLREINETYLQHMKFAVKCGFKMLAAGLVIFIHALLPCLFQTTASDAMNSLINDIDRRKKLAKTNLSKE